MFDIFRSDFQRGEDDKFEKNHVLKLVENVRKVFDEKSDKTSCAAPCIECEKRFLTKKKFNKHHGLYHELEVQSMRETLFDEKDIQQTSLGVPRTRSAVNVRNVFDEKEIQQTSWPVP